MLIDVLRLEQLDGAQPENKELRNKLFNVSNVRGKYPQVFIQNEKGELEYVGMDDDIDVCVYAKSRHILYFF